MVSLLLLLIMMAPGALMQDECEGSSCNPQLGDLMVGRGAQLSASSTCGLDGPQNYCIIGYLEDEQKCFTCDSRLPYSDTNPDSHRVENVITAFDPERRMKWWQSENGVHRVSIKLDLETLFQFSHLVLTFKSFRPAAMLVERSKDHGRTWKVFRYFAEDCALHFPGVSDKPGDSVDDVVCDSRYSGSDPSTDGEVVLKALDPTFDIDNPYAPHIQELITMTNIRINFTRLFTLGDVRKRRNPEDKYYYALYDMVVRGSCFCNGHASQCMPVGGSRGDVFNEPGMVHGRCLCQHNTMGDNCEICQDFHNDAPWRPGGEHGPNICRRCNCHGHSETCHFDIARYEASGKVSGGVCDNCQHDRAGPQCEQCRPYLYQDPQSSVEDPSGCIPCDCDPMGSKDSGLCDPVTGQCVCKENVEGERCDRCKYGFFGLRQEDPAGCQKCRCNLLGSIQSTHACDQETGECVCDRLATGPFCDRCLPGFWGLGNTAHRCTPCDCDVGGAHGTMCSPDDGQCQCLPNMVGRRCSEPTRGHFLPALDYFLYEAEFASPRIQHPRIESTVSPDPQEVPEYPERPEYPENPQRPEDPEIPEDPEHPEYPENPQRPEDPERPEESQLPEVTERLGDPQPREDPQSPEVTERPEYPENPERPEYPEYPERPEYPEYPERPEYPEYPERPERPEYPEYPERPREYPENPERPEYPEYPERPEYPENPERPEYPEYPLRPTPEYPEYPLRPTPEYPEYPLRPTPEYPEYPLRPTPEYPEHPENPQSPEDPQRPEYPEYPERPEYPENPERPEYPERTEYPENPERTEYPENPHRPEYPENPQRPEDPQRPEYPEYPERPEYPEYPERPEDPENPDHLEHRLPTPYSEPPENPVNQGNQEPVDPYDVHVMNRNEFAASQVKPALLPDCEQHFREQGYDVKYSNGRMVLLRRTRRHARWRRQEQQMTIPLDPGSALQIVPRPRTADRPITWTGPGFVRALDRAGLRFTVDNIPKSIAYQLVIRYEPESPDDWIATITIFALSPGDNHCPVDPTGTKTLSLPGNARGAVLDTAICLNSGGRYFVDIMFNKEPNPDSSSHILIDSMGLIPSLESVEDFCSQNDLDSFRRFRCLGLSADLTEQVTLPEVCESLVGSMSARIYNGAMACRCNIQGSVGPSCSKFGGLCDCKPNVIGRCCDTCAPLTFGFGPDGCELCDCDPRGSVSELCDQVRGQCPCRREVAGRRCERCQPGYWGFPLCRPCDCNGQAELCDQETGACLNCRGHSTGANCERCEENYYGDPVSRVPCEPCLCPDTKNSGLFFASSCSKNLESPGLTCNCLPGHTDSRCDKCVTGFYGNLTVPGARCEECPCNNNIDPGEHGACDSVTGECLRCLHNTTGARCEDCMPGYYGDALDQDCKECSCDRRGTEVTQCPLRSPCFCDPKTGQCPCRTGAVGVLCDECDDGYWNIAGASGCQPCNCDPTNSLNNICDKVSGQCQCRIEFGGRQCDECGENHFGNPDLQCISCDCNLEGTERPSCDPETGECLCRIGVTGIFCDECAPGYDSEFPACAPCHPCSNLWLGNVTDVQRAAQRMQTLIPRYGDEVEPAYRNRWRRMEELHNKLDWMVNLTGKSFPKMDSVEKLCLKIGRLKDSIDPNLIMIDPSPLLDNDIDNIRNEFKKLLDKLRDMPTEEPDVDEAEIEELMDEIKKVHKEFMADEKKVKNANKALEDSMDTRQEVKKNLATCGRRGNSSQLEEKLQGLSVKHLNEKICGAPNHEECSKSKCGGALCRTFWGNRICGGPTCEGILPTSLNATETAKKVEDGISDILNKLKDSKNKISDAKQMALDTKDLADKLQDRINDKKDKFEREKNETKELIKRVKDYLRDEMVPPEDIEMMAKAVLAIQLPGSPDEIRSMINKIRDLLVNVTDIKVDLKKLEEQAKIAKDLRKKALDLKDRTKDIDVTEIRRTIYDAEKIQSEANDDLEDASNDIDMTKDQIKETKEKLDDIDNKLNGSRPKTLLDEIEALKNKTEMNREQAKEAKEVADAALADATDAQTDFENVKNLLDILKEKNGNQTLQDEASERLKNITMEAEKLKKQVEDKLKKIEDLEKGIQDLLKKKENFVNQIAMMLLEVESLRKEIAKRAEGYAQCV